MMPGGLFVVIYGQSIIRRPVVSYIIFILQ